MGPYQSSGRGRQSLTQVVKVVAWFRWREEAYQPSAWNNTPHPWLACRTKFRLVLKLGQIVNVADMVHSSSFQPGVEGLIHVSEMSWSAPAQSSVISWRLRWSWSVVLTIDRRAQDVTRHQTTYRKIHDPSGCTFSKYAVGTRHHKGIVRNPHKLRLVHRKLEEGIDGPYTYLT